MPRRGRRSGPNPLFLIGVALLMFGLLMTGVGMFMPVQASTMYSMFSTMASPRTKITFINAYDQKILFVHAYDYINDVSYSTTNGELMLPEGSYIVKSPGFEPVVLHLYGTNPEEYVELTPLPLDEAVIDISSDTGLSKMSMIDLNRLVLFSVVVSSVDLKKLADKYSDRSAKDAVGTPCGIGIAGGMGDAISGEVEGVSYIYCTAPARSIYRVKISDYLYYFSEQGFQNFINAVKAERERLNQEVQEKLQSQLKMAGLKYIYLKAREGINFKITQDLIDYPTSGYSTFIKTGENISGVSADLLIYYYYSGTGKYDFSVAQGKVSDSNPFVFDWPDEQPPRQSYFGKVIGPPDRLEVAARIQLPTGYTLSKVEMPNDAIPGFKKLYPNYDAYGELRLSSKNEYYITVYAWPSWKDPKQYAINTCTIKGKAVIYDKKKPIDNITALPVAINYVASMMIERREGKKFVYTQVTDKVGEDGYFSFTLRVPKDSNYEYLIYIGTLRLRLKVKGSDCSVSEGRYSLKVLSKDPLIVGIEKSYQPSLKSMPIVDTSKVKVEGEAAYTSSSQWGAIVKEMNTKPKTTADLPTTTSTTITSTSTTTTSEPEPTVRITATETTNPDGSKELVLSGQPRVIPLDSRPSTSDLQPTGKNSQSLVNTGIATSLIGAGLSGVGLMPMGAKGGRRRR